MTAFLRASSVLGYNTCTSPTIVSSHTHARSHTHTHTPLLLTLTRCTTTCGLCSHRWQQQQLTTANRKKRQRCDVPVFSHFFPRSPFPCHDNQNVVTLLSFVCRLLSEWLCVFVAMNCSNACMLCACTWVSGSGKNAYDCDVLLRQELANNFVFHFSQKNVQPVGKSELQDVFEECSK